MTKHEKYEILNLWLWRRAEYILTVYHIIHFSPAASKEWKMSHRLVWIHSKLTDCPLSRRTIAMSIVKSSYTESYSIPGNYKRVWKVDEYEWYRRAKTEFDDADCQDGSLKSTKLYDGINYIRNRYLQNRNCKILPFHWTSTKYSGREM